MIARILFLSALWALTPSLSAASSPDGLELFQNKIQPLLEQHCYSCHSAQSEKLKGGLHLDSRQGLLDGGDTGPAIIPGNPDASLLLRALEYADSTLQMPPKQKLPEDQIALFRDWIALGAPDPRTNTLSRQTDVIDYAAARLQWPFQPPPDPPLPSVQNTSWPRNGIDHFILQKLEAAQLRPANPAEKRTLIRRLYLNLIGIPPTPQEVDDFLGDNSSDALGRLVDRLLASPLYGERWARHWLDVVRYTDSNDARGIGGPADIPEAYRYRDWVVKAFNSDLPYNQFILQQFAGDLLQPASREEFNPDALIATSLFVIGEWGTGDADKEKMMTDIVDDQIDVTGRAFLGLTLACARCHDHKFDPISAQDYYGLAGIFFSSHILPDPGRKTEGSPVLKIPLASPAELDRRNAREQRIKSLEQELDSLKDRLLEPTLAQQLSQLPSYLSAAAEYKISYDKGELLDIPSFARHSGVHPQIFARWIDFLGFGELPLLADFTRDIAGKPGLHAWKGPSDTPSVVVNTTGADVTFLTIRMPPHSLAMHPSPNAAVAVAFRAPANGTYTLSGRLSDADPNCGNGIDWAITIRSQGRLLPLGSGSLDNGGTIDSLPLAKGNNHAFQLQEGDLLELTIGPRNDYSCDTTIFHLEIEGVGAGKKWNVTSDILAAIEAGETKNPVRTWLFYDLGKASPARKLAEGSSLHDWFAALDTNNFSGATFAAAALQNDLLELRAKQEQGTNREELTKTPNGKIFDLLTSPRSQFWKPLRDAAFSASKRQQDQLATLSAELNSLIANPPPPLPLTHAMLEGGVPDSPHAGIKDARIHIRGRYDRLGEVVPRRFPKVLAGDSHPPITAGSGRLQLAQWIASPKNPLTARVLVNRLWQHHFGEGLVRTPNNFGALGEPPTHPELLDWLAHRFIESGWSIKAMHRLILLSATYGQSTAAPKQTFEADPDNRLWGRMNRRRMDAEVLRDSILFANGSLDPAQGGKAIRDLNSRRRTLYQMSIRSIRNDYRALFDAPDPSAIIEKRTESTVAPQALFILNHPFMLAETRRLAEQLLSGNSRNDAARVHWLYTTLYSRPPTHRELELAATALDRIYATTKGSFADRELAAWQAYSQLLLAANEFLFID